MKKNMEIIFIILLLTLFITGCESRSEKKLNQLKSDLQKEAEKIFLTDAWTKGGIKEGTYTLTLSDLKKNLNVDISKYKNPETNSVCDDTESKIDFIVSRQTEPDKTNYKLKVTLVCE